MPSPNEELQQYEDEYFDRRFNEAVRGLFSIRTLILIAFLLVYSGSFINDFFHVYPSTLGIVVALAICGLLAIGLAAWFISLPTKKIAQEKNSSSPDRSMDVTMGIVAATVLAPIVFNLFLGCLITILGIPGETRVTEYLWRDASSGRYSASCAGPIVQDVWYDSDIVCLDPHRKREFPDGSHITLKGKTSLLGMNVEDAVPHW